MNDPDCRSWNCINDRENAAWLEAELVEALRHLHKLADWGWGANAPDLAKIDWQNARAFLETSVPIDTEVAHERVQ